MKKLLYIVIILAVAAYVLSPVDFIPDVFLGFGWIDDAALIAIAMRIFYIIKRKSIIKKAKQNGEEPIEVDFKNTEDEE